MHCWKCGTLLSAFSGKTPFRATCDICHTWLHTCCNCKNYKPGLPNNCAIPGTEYIADREAFNFCEEFEFLGTFPQKKKDPREIEKRLFSNDDQLQKEPESPSNPFDSLFNP